MSGTPRIDGLDLHDVYQPVTDWAAATSYRLMSCKVTEGKGNPRPGGLDYFRQFRNHGVALRGIYHWLRSDSSMAAQVDALGRAVDALGGLQAGEFIQLDWETTPGIPHLDVSQVEEWLALVDERWPNRTIVYASDWVPGFPAWRLDNPNRPLWYANYNTSDKPTGGWAECARWGATVWQWSSTVTVPGIANRVDANHVFDWAAIERIAGLVVAPDVLTPQPQEADMAQIDYNGMVLVYDGYTVRRVENGNVANLLGAPTPVVRDTLRALIAQCRTQGANPFDGLGDLGPYRDDELAAIWQSRPTVEVSVSLPHISGGAVTLPAVTGTITFG